MDRACNIYVYVRKAYNIVYWRETQEGKRPVGTPRCRWVANIEVGLRIVRIGWCRWD
jgi:hypothetical protein